MIEAICAMLPGRDGKALPRGQSRTPQGPGFLKAPRCSPGSRPTEVTAAHTAARFIPAAWAARIRIIQNRMRAAELEQIAAERIPTGCPVHVRTPNIQGEGPVRPRPNILVDLFMQRLKS